MLKKLKENILASSYEDRAGRSVISVKTLMEIIDQLAAEQSKSEITKLPRIGDKVKLKACCECVCTLMDWETGCRECPFEDSCEFEDCENGNEREFETSVTRIWSDGLGWYFGVLGLDLEIPVRDIGRTVFLIEEPERKE